MALNVEAILHKKLNGGLCIRITTIIKTIKPFLVIELVVGGPHVVPLGVDRSIFSAGYG